MEREISAFSFYSQWFVRKIGKHSNEKSCWLLVRPPAKEPTNFNRGGSVDWPNIIFVYASGNFV